MCCRGCKKRSITCHSECEDYIAFTKEREVINYRRSLRVEADGYTRLAKEKSRFNGGFAFTGGDQ